MIRRYSDSSIVSPNRCTIAANDSVPNRFTEEYFPGAKIKYP